MESSTRFREHLLSCNLYIETTITKSIQASNPFALETSDTRIQRSLNFPRLTPTQKHEFDIQAAMMCFVGNHPFTIFEEHHAKKLIHLLNPAWKPPSKKAISGPLLDAVYADIEKQIDQCIVALPYLNIITDESTNIKQARICNISIHSERGSILYTSEDKGAKRMTTVGTAEWLRDHLATLTNRDLTRLNSVTTDTCDTMLKMWTELQHDDEFKRCLFIPCNSRGIQLLVKDILMIQRFKDILHPAQSIVKAFKDAPLQYARLKRCQVKVYGEPRSLILSIVTRWGTQYRLVCSVLNNKDALRRYALEYDDLPMKQKLKYGAIEFIMSKEFWAELELMRELLKPIDEALKMSESGKAHLGHVLGHWTQITKHLMQQQADFPVELEPFLDPVNGAFSHRYKRQVTSLHVVAFYLVPGNHDKALSLAYDQQIYGFFRHHAQSEAEFAILQEEFESFRSQLSPFEPQRRCWFHKDPKIFWHASASNTQHLGKLALRIFSCPINSGASERAFSVQNLINTKERNALHAERANKLTYIYIDGRILANVNNTAKQDDVELKSILNDLSFKEEVQLEDELLNREQDDAMVFNGFQDEEEEREGDTDSAYNDVADDEGRNFFLR